jgi:hypothetical protein
MPHQLEAAWRAYHRLTRGEGKRGYYWAHAPGVGKTLSAITLIRLLQPVRTLVVTNAPGWGVWQRELDHWWEPGKWQAPPTYRHLDPDIPIAIYTYDQFKGPYGVERQTIVKNWKPGLVVLDESHKIKGAGSVRSKTLAKIIERIELRLLMSGTPAHSPLDWWAQYRYVDPENPRWKQRFTQYKKEIAVFGGPEGVWIEGFRADVCAQVSEEMAPLTHVATEEVLDLEEPLETVIPVTLNTKEQKAYKDLAKEMLYASEYGVTSVANPMLKPMRLHQVTSGWLMTDPEEDEVGARHLVELGDSKLQVLREVLDERAQEKVVISAYFLNDLQRIAGLCARLKRPLRVIDGSTSKTARTGAEDWFQGTDEQNAVIVLQQQAGGEAITLTASRFLVLFSLAPSVIAFRQVLGRIFRKGQTRRAQVLYLSGSKNDEAIFKGLKQGLDEAGLQRMLLEQLRQEALSHATQP